MIMRTLQILVTVIASVYSICIFEDSLHLNRVEINVFKNIRFLEDIFEASKAVNASVETSDALESKIAWLRSIGNVTAPHLVRQKRSLWAILGIESLQEANQRYIQTEENSINRRRILQELSEVANGLQELSTLEIKDIANLHKEVAKLAELIHETLTSMEKSEQFIFQYIQVSELVDSTMYWLTRKLGDLLEEYELRKLGMPVKKEVHVYGTSYDNEVLHVIIGTTSWSKMPCKVIETFQNYVCVQMGSRFYLLKNQDKLVIERFSVSVVECKENLPFVQENYLYNLAIKELCTYKMN